MSPVINKRPEESSVLICGTARNIERKIDEYFQIMTCSFTNFKTVTFLVCESFSDDRTQEKLELLQKSGVPLEFFIDKDVALDEKSRTVRIASARNSIRKVITEKYKTFDYVVMADMDGVNRDLTKEAVDSCWKWKGWDVAFSNQPYRYYDIWALRADNWCEYDCWAEYVSLSRVMTAKRAKKIAITSKMRSISVNASPIEVKSAFGGLAIYKMEAFLSGEYLGKTTDGYAICEHVTFHADLHRKDYKLFIIPSFVNLAPSSQRMNIIRDRFIKLAKFFNTWK